jgi:flagellar basal body rod protein FlgB
MLFGFIGRVSPANSLKDGLDVSSQRTRVIADRVARASLQQPNGGFALPATGAPAGSAEQGPIDLEAEMVSLADEQLRYEATAKLLQKAYQNIRTSIRER